MLEFLLKTKLPSSPGGQSVMSNPFQNNPLTGNSPTRSIFGQVRNPQQPYPIQPTNPEGITYLQPRQDQTQQQSQMVQLAPQEVNANDTTQLQAYLQQQIQANAQGDKKAYYAIDVDNSLKFFNTYPEAQSYSTIVKNQTGIYPLIRKSPL